MDFFKKNLRETIDAINKLIEKNIYIVTTKMIRQCNGIKPSNCSKINFIWRTLDYLDKVGVIEKDSSTQPKSYKTKLIKKKDLEKIISF